MLQTKKRYVGYAYESLDQAEPIFDAKGIETVRRDNCPVVSRMMEKMLRLLFETKDISAIREYTQDQVRGRGSICVIDFRRVVALFILMSF